MMTFKRAVRVWDRKNKTYLSVWVEVTINEMLLANHLGEKAIKNKSKKSAIQSGIIVGKIVGVET